MTKRNKIGNQMTSTNNNKVGYEKSDVNIFMVIGLSIISVVLLIIIVVFLDNYFVEATEQMIYEEQLQPESVDLKSLLESEKKELNSYKVLDEENGVYQIPIDLAMEILVKEASKKN
jgi:hypothetical protein